MRARSAMAGLSLCCALSVFGQDNLVRVNLEETGIASPRFQNPKAPVPLNTTDGLDFFNSTSNRTFVVMIPFEMREDEAKSKYSLAAVQRQNRSLGTYVCAVLAQSDRRCSAEQQRQLDRLETLQLFGERLAGAFADSDLFAELNEIKPGDVLDMSHIEALYWTAACPLDADERSRLGVGDDAPPRLLRELAEQADALVGRSIPNGPPTRRGCDRFVAMDIRDQVLAKFKSASGAAAGSTFATSRKKLVLNALKLATGDAVRKQYEQPELVAVLDSLEAERLRLQPLQKENDQKSSNVARCLLHLVRTAAMLTASYGPDAFAPLMSPFTADDPTGACVTSPELRAQGYNIEERDVEVLARYRQLSVASEVGIEITDCAGTTCVARATIPPNGRAVFSRSVLEHRSNKVVQFTVAFFDDNQPPANATGYAFLGRKEDVRPSAGAQALSFGFGADGAIEYGLPSKALQQHTRRAFGGGSISVAFTGLVDVSATLQFKKGDFGGATTTTDVKASQYQAKIFGPRGTTLQLGKFDFAAPSSSIAIAESGEGFKFGFNYWTLGYLVRRESDAPDQVADVDDDDKYVIITQFTNPPINLKGLRSFSFTALAGNDENDSVPKEVTAEKPAPRPYQFGTFGGDLGFSVGLPNVIMTLAAYHSVRNVNPDKRNPPPPFITPVSDGEGTVALGKFILSRVVEQNLKEPLKQAKPAFSLTVTGAYGSGDDPNTLDKDEGYIGETAGFAQDKLFLSKLASVAVIRDADNAVTSSIGGGLANKYYLGVQYSEARWSPLVLATHIFDARDEVVSMATILSAHKYWFVREVSDRRDAGYELDLDFQIETPKNVRWTLSGAWYRRSAAVKLYGIEKNPWSATANVSIKLSGR